MNSILCCALSVFLCSCKMAAGQEEKPGELPIIHPQLHDMNMLPNALISTQQFQEFHYDGLLGPDNWPSLFTSCAGEHQSPIAINKTNSLISSNAYFVYKNYGVFLETATITNNGHTAMVTLPIDVTIKGGDLPGDYELLNFHFHWGSDSSRGSEHIIEGVHYPLELHIVHWNLKYSTSHEAMDYTDGIAVLAILFHVEPLDNPLLDPITEALASIITSGTNMTFKTNFRLSDLLPPKPQQYYRYNGSLTTPECKESVIWTVFAHTNSISEYQLNAFRNLLDIENKDRENNYRPVQPVNSRTIYLNGL